MIVIIAKTPKNINGSKNIIRGFFNLNVFVSAICHNISIIGYEINKENSLIWSSKNIAGKTFTEKNIAPTSHIAHLCLISQKTQSYLKNQNFISLCFDNLS